MHQKVTKYINISNIQHNFRVCFVDITDSQQQDNNDMKPTNWEFFRNLATMFKKKSSRANYLDCCRDLGKIWPNLQIRTFLKYNVLKCFFTFLITKYWWIYSARLGSLCYMYDLRQIVKDFYGVTGAKQGLVSLRELAPQCQILECLACKCAFRCCSFIMSQQIPSFPKFINSFCDIITLELYTNSIVISSYMYACI